MDDLLNKYIFINDKVSKKSRFIKIIKKPALLNTLKYSVNLRWFTLFKNNLINLFLIKIFQPLARLFSCTLVACTELDNTIQSNYKSF